MSRLPLAAVITFTAAFLFAPPSQAQDSPAVVSISLDEAMQIATQRNYALLTAALDVENADAQVSEAWGQLFPQVDASAGYTRNLKQADPFAGSSAGNLFGGLGAIDWLVFNEDARTDDNPGTDPIAFSEFLSRQQDGLDAAGIVVEEGGNPFAVDNQFQGAITITQTLYSGSAFAAVRGARSLKDFNQAALETQLQDVLHQTRQAFYGALLAQNQVRVLAASVERSAQNVDETTRRVAQGVMPKFERLTAEVELANLETQLIDAEAQAALASDNLLLTLGLPVADNVRLRGDLDLPSDALFQSVMLADAVETAMERRPDLTQARLGVELRQVDRGITRSQYFPTIEASATLAYSGNVPDDRTVTLQPDQNDPFLFESDTEGFFSDAYWQPNVSVGVSLRWNLFNGFQTTRRMQQRQIAIDQAEIALAQATESARLDVSRALRDLRSAQQRIAAQDQNVQRAETAYSFAEARLENGVATPLQVRDASNALDQSRLAYLQAVHDLLIARSNLERATGTLRLDADADPSSEFTMR
ncbi:MAG: TolC family protein [Bacteroidota bacterium]